MKISKLAHVERLGLVELESAKGKGLYSVVWYPLLHGHLTLKLFTEASRLLAHSIQPLGCRSRLGLASLSPNLFLQVCRQYQPQRVEEGLTKY